MIFVSFIFLCKLCLFSWIIFLYTTEAALSTHPYSSSITKEEREPLPGPFFFFLIPEEVFLDGEMWSAYQNMMRKNIVNTQVGAIRNLKWKLLLCVQGKDCLQGRRDKFYLYGAIKCSTILLLLPPCPDPSVLFPSLS